jgi:hypothetical protein
MTTFLLLAAMTVVAVLTGGFNLLFGAIIQFASSSNINVDTSVSTSLQIIPAGIVLAMLSSLVGSSVAKISGVDYSSHNGLAGLSKISVWSLGFFLLSVEEGFFRIIPIYTSNYFGWNDSLTLLIASLLFALIHLSNFKEKGISALAVLPQFFSGLLFSVVAISFGWWTAFLFHLYFDLVIFAGDKKQKFGLVDILIVLYYLAITAIGFHILGGVEYFSTLNLNSFETLKATDSQIIGSVMLVFGIVYSVLNLFGFDTPLLAEESKLQGYGKSLFVGCFAGFLFAFVGVFAFRIGADFFSNYMELITVFITGVALLTFPLAKLFKFSAFNTILCGLIIIPLWNVFGHGQIVDVSKFIMDALNFQANPLMIYLTAVYCFTTLLQPILVLIKKDTDTPYEANSSASEMAGKGFALISTSFVFLTAIHCTHWQAILLAMAIGAVSSGYLFLQHYND